MMLVLTNKVCVEEALEIVAGNPKEDQEASYHRGAPCDGDTCMHSATNTCMYLHHLNV